MIPDRATILAIFFGSLVFLAVATLQADANHGVRCNSNDRGPGTVYTDGGQLPGVIYEGEDDLEPLMPGNNASVNKATAKKVRRSRRSGTSKFVAPEIRLGRATQAADGLADLMGYNDMSIIQHIMATGGGVDAIINEIMWNGTAKDKQNLQELLDGTYQINDTDASPEELAARRMTLDEWNTTVMLKWNARSTATTTLKA
eukprot:gene7688-4352_t